MNLRKTTMKCYNCGNELMLVDSSNGGNDFSYWRHRDNSCGVSSELIEKFEKLAELEHEQWERWSKTIAEELELILTYLQDGATMTANDLLITRLNKWKTNWKPYSELDEETKEFDRDWARKVIKIMVR